jgi:hypothetical protein
MAKEIRDTKTQERSFWTVFVIGGATWLLLTYFAPHYVPLLKNVTDGGPIEAGVDLVASVLKPLTLFLIPEKIMLGIDTFVFGGIAAPLVMRAIAVTKRDEVFRNLPGSATGLIRGIRDGISRHSARAAATLAYHRNRSSTALGNRSFAFLQGCLETAVAATSKHLLSPEIDPDHPEADAGVRLRVAESTTKNADEFGAKRQAVIGDFSYRKLAASEMRNADGILAQVYTDYKAVKPRSDLKRQIAAARENHARAEEDLCITRLFKKEALDAFDQIRNARRQMRGEISDRLSAMQSSDGAELLSLATEQLLEPIESLIQLQAQYPKAAKLEGTRTHVEFLQEYLAQRTYLKTQLLPDEIRWAIQMQRAAQVKLDQANKICSAGDGSARAGKQRRL